jgi:cyanophycinase
MAGGTLLSGGAIDDDAAMRRLLGRGGGKVDVVVLDAYGGDIYGAPYMASGADSVDYFVLSSPAGAAQAQVLDGIDHAEVIWLDGGDQYTYVAEWAGTPLQAHVNARIAQGAAFGGMSAGLAVQGGWIFTALHGSITSDKALVNPYNRDVTLGGALFDLPFMDDVLTDAHFGVRDRMGRPLTFQACLEQDAAAIAPLAVAVDEDSSIGIDAQTGVAHAFGAGDGVWLASTASVTTWVVAPKAPLTYGPVTVQHLPTGDTFDFAAWASPDGDTYAVSATGGVLSATAPGTPN